MGRLVRSPKVADLDLQIAGLEGMLQSGIAGMQVTNSEPGDSYLERMVKYVPAEIIAFSMVINSILDQAMKSGGPNATMAGVPVPVIATIALVVACILAPLFCWYVRQDGDAWAINAAVSTVAMPFWAYLMGAVAFANFHDGNLAAILVLSFTVISGLVAPWPEKAKLREQAVASPPVETAAERPRLVDVLAG
jgi:heme/copper-type cytochrome/quinol oxidase subunit 3